MDALVEDLLTKAAIGTGGIAVGIAGLWLRMREKKHALEMEIEELRQKRKITGDKDAERIKLTQEAAKVLIDLQQHNIPRSDLVQFLEQVIKGTPKERKRASDASSPISSKRTVEEITKVREELESTIVYFTLVMVVDLHARGATSLTEEQIISIGQEIERIAKVQPDARERACHLMRVLRTHGALQLLNWLEGRDSEWDIVDDEFPTPSAQQSEAIQSPASK